MLMYPRWAGFYKPTGWRMADHSGLMQGKRGVILGVANNRSIAWGIAKACRAAGAEIALTWQGDALKKRVEPLARELDGLLLGHCDVTDASTIETVFDVLRQKWGRIDFLVTPSPSPTRTSSTAAISRPRRTISRTRC
jgi:enoyl-[acyl-carrier protein] reductase I